jgi:hypothetical protein
MSVIISAIYSKVHLHTCLSQVTPELSVSCGAIGVDSDMQLGVMRLKIIYNRHSVRIHHSIAKISIDEYVS